jgi:hypothetical protein
MAEQNKILLRPNIRTWEHLKMKIAIANALFPSACGVTLSFAFACATQIRVTPLASNAALKPNRLSRRT